MNTIIEYLPLLIPIAIAAAVLAFIASRTRYTLQLTVAMGVLALFAFCFLMWAGASLHELLLAAAVLLIPSLLFCKTNGRDGE